MIDIPTEDYTPLIVLHRFNERFRILGELSDFVKGYFPEPEITRNKAVVEILDEKVVKLEGGLGLEVLNGIVSCLGGGGIGIETYFKKVDFIKLLYRNVLMDSVYPSKIGKYLSNNSPDEKAPFMECFDEEGKACIITDTLKSNTFGVLAFSGRGRKIDIEISALEDLLSTTQKIEISKNIKKAIFFKGEKYLSFAFKKIEFWVEVVNDKTEFKCRLGPTLSKKVAQKPTLDLYERKPVFFSKERPAELGILQS